MAFPRDLRLEPLANFQEIADTVLLHRPSSASSLNTKLSLVVLCTWFGANRKHISKYTEHYRERYPDSDILIVESTFGTLLAGNKKASNAARDIILSYVTSGPPRPILLHVFSNGGAQSATQLASSLPGDWRGFKATVLDSCPGEPRYSPTVKAITFGFPKSTVVRFVGTLLVHIVLCLVFICDRLFGAENSITRSRRLLNTPTVLSLDTPRIYIYSKSDPMVVFDDVHKHAVDARKGGYNSVEEFLFEDSGHCAHAMLHEKEYWKAVDNVVINN